MIKRMTLLASTALAVLASPALAQDAQDADDGASDEISVAATLREADVQDIPLAVTAIAPATLDRQGVTDIKTLSSISPSSRPARRVPAA